MTVVRQLSDVLQYIRGVTFDPDELISADEHGAIACMRTKNVQQVLDESDLIYVPKSVVKREEQFLKAGDLLISSANSWELVGKTVRVEQLAYPATAGGFISILRPNADVVDPDYLYRFISWHNTQHTIRHLGRQTTNISNLDRERFLELSIPLPPLATQQHIARVLEQADQLRKQAQQMERELNQLAQSLFLEMFGKYFYDKSLFETSSEEIANLVAIIDYRGKTPEKTDSGIPLITAKNVKQGYINPEPREFIAEETYGTWMSRGYPEENDVLFTTEAPLGNVAKLGRYEKVVIGQRLLDLRCGNKLKPDYLVFALQNELIQQAILARSTGSTVKGIRSKVFEKISIPVPPIELQIKFSDFMAQIEKISSEQSEKSTKIENLFESAMQRAFNGELTAPERKAA